MFGLVPDRIAPVSLWSAQVVRTSPSHTISTKDRAKVLVPEVDTVAELRELSAEAAPASGARLSARVATRRGATMAISMWVSPSSRAGADWVVEIRHAFDTACVFSNSTGE